MDETCLELGLGLISEHARKRDNLQKNNKCGGVVLDLSIPSHDPMANLSSSLKTTSVGGDERLGMKKALSNRRKEEDDWNNVCNRKKLRLTKDQSVLLEDTFKKHSTLNTAQKHTLAEQLNLKPRQVEVWFQNRRARTKLKQTEINCEFLRKNCERLSEENRRLKKELLELQRSSAGRQPFVYSRINPTEAKCDSCEKGSRGGKPEAAASGATGGVVPEAKEESR